MEKQIKSRKRVRDHGEVYTSEREINAMLDLVKDESYRVDARFLEPACGNGNFIIKILERKLETVDKAFSGEKWKLWALIGVANIYGIEYLEDNLAECHNRVMKTLSSRYASACPGDDDAGFLQSIEYIVTHNIVWGDTLRMKTPDGISNIVFPEWTHIGNGMILRRDFDFSPFAMPEKKSKKKIEEANPEPILVKEYEPVFFSDISKVSTI